jgi:serine phosphatase RsbU (regulator of sigma subunit)
MTSVAGDFYDFIAIDDTHLGILIADVSGHGLPSALIASMLQVALTAQVAHASDPAKVLSGLNHALCGKFTQNFVTAAYVYVDLEKNSMRYAGAGHPPLLLCRASTGKAAKVLENGLILGVFPEATYEALELPLEPGDRIALYTDGILEAANAAQEQFGADRFMSFMENNKSLRADQFADAFLGEISQWLEQSPEQGQQDDVTLLVIGICSNLKT